ncbi:hypothetical protein CYMTET_32172 [Cymbomonas tetramitiformis]|uniref:Uncharacterized protein n=1 Tax=Cymbomonas tetramitiformis TaxID=36881 RepID=A0AAE0KS79_9CHLO|nr:hypothetical protein CYMTET_32172 [Cymbomonas tetramitiformis]
MATSAGSLAVWTEPRMKVQLQKLLKLSELTARTRVATWQKQRDQIMAWVAEHVSELREIPTEVEDLTEGLIEAELFTVDVVGTLMPVHGLSVLGRSGSAVQSGVLTTPAATAGGSGAGAPSGGGPGGGVPAGAAGVQGALGAGTIASAIAAPGAGASALTASVTATTVGTGTTMGSAAGGGPGGGVPAGAAGAQGAFGVGTVASAAAAPGAGAHAMDPQSIAAAIAAAVGAKFDALGEQLATLEAQRLAAGGAPAACADLVHEAAKLRPQLTALRTVHPFGKTPMRTLEAHAFEPLAYILPELRAEECEMDELPPGSEATVEHWRAFVHLLQARVGEFQRFVKSQVPTFTISDVMVASFFKKHKRVTFEGEEEEARAAGGGHRSLPPLDRLATLGAGFRTVNEEQLARALRGELAPEDVIRPPVQRLQQEDEGRLKLKDGELTMVAKKKMCKDFSEWERGFLRILCEAPAEARDDLMDFVEWARTIAAEFSFYHFNEFYEHLVRQVQRSATGISAEAKAGALGVVEAAEAVVAAGEAVGASRTRATGTTRATVGISLTATSGMFAARVPRSSSEAPAGADGVPVAAPDLMVEADAELEFGQPIAVEDIGAVDAQVGCGPPDVEDGGGVPLVSPGGAIFPGRWWADLRENEFIPV